MVEESKYKEAYKALKGKLHSLIYENECFKLALRKNQKLMLKVTRDRSFLLDKLLEKEKVEHSTSESDPTESSSEEEPVPPQAKRRKLIKKPPKKKADGHMTPEEVERHLQAQSFLDLVPERPPLTVPTEMFSHEPSSLDSESNLETSPLQEEIINIL